MRLESVRIKNFRCFREELIVPVSRLTTLIGRNDAGKSTILEALEVFFGNAKPDPADCCVHSEGDTFWISCEFSDLPHKLTLDAGAETSLSDEYLTTKDDRLVVMKAYKCLKTKANEEVFVVANHPTAQGCDDLLQLKEAELRERVESLGLNGPLKGNPSMRRSIWDSTDELALDETAVPVSGGEGDAKAVWRQLECHLPLFELFRSDRPSQDSDNEVQDPMKAAVKAAIAEVSEQIATIEDTILERTKEIAARTHAALLSLDPVLGAELEPTFKPPTASRWAGLFSVGMETDHGIPLNKRGSGVRRMVLISFFKAEAERKLESSDRRSIIYAVEEPETAQHPKNQQVLVRAFTALTMEPGCQVLLTTHNPGFASDLPAEGMRFLEIEEGTPVIRPDVDALDEVAGALGVTPDSRVAALICVEGPTDVAALVALSRALHAEDDSIPDLSTDKRFAFVVLGGSTLKHWVTNHYLKGLRRPEFHIYDNDVASYGDRVAEVNDRGDGSWGVQTEKHEIESYLHPDAITTAFEVDVEVTDQPNEEGKATPRVFAEVYSAARAFDGVMKDTTAKRYLADQAFPHMTARMLAERDPDGEVVGWFRRMVQSVDQ